MRNRRTFLLLLAAILAVAAVWVNLRPREAKPAVNLVPVAVASQDIQPYTIISANQVTLGSETIPETLAMDYYQQPEEIVGLMSARFIKANQQISREDAKPIEKVRFVEDMSLEIVSFPAIFSEMVAGQVKPGHRINIYGYRVESGKDRPGEAILVASNVWVVDVRTAGGEEVQKPEEPTPEAGGLFSAPGAAAIFQPASVVSVAAPPAVVRDIIYALGAKDYQAWVTLAPSSENIPPLTALLTPTPQAQETPAPQAQVTPTTTTTTTIPTILVGAIYMSDRDGGPKVDVFPNNTSVVWAVVNLQYSPDGAEPIRIEVHSEGGKSYFAGDLTHPRSGQSSYLIVPTGTQGFAPDTTYTTTLYARDKRFTVVWALHGDSWLPKTGEDSSATGDTGSDRN